MAEKKTTVAKKTEEKKIAAAPKPEAKKAETKTAKPIDVWSVIVHPSLSEKSIRSVEAQNKLVFVVKRKANKQQVKQAVEAAFGVKVEKVNIQNTANGIKKAYVRLSPENHALDVATKLGMM